MGEEMPLFNSPTKTSAKKGRRAAPPPPSSASGSLETEDADLGLADDILMSPTSASSRPTTSASRKSVPAPKAESNHVRAVPSARPHRMTGWAEEGFHLGRRKSTASVLEEERFREADHIVKADSDEEEPVIPDLGDVQDEDFSQQVAQAPTVAVNRVATYKELDSDLFRHSAFATLDEIDLRALTKCMTSEAEVKEVDCPWTWDGLYAEVRASLLEGSTKDDQMVMDGMSTVTAI